MWTPFNDTHYGCQMIRCMYDIRGMNATAKTICIVDEVDLTGDEKNQEINEYLKMLKVNMVGFYR